MANEKNKLWTKVLNRSLLMEYLPSGTKCWVHVNEFGCRHLAELIWLTRDYGYFVISQGDHRNPIECYIDDFMPMLRPMDNMTNKEKRNYEKLKNGDKVKLKNYLKSIFVDVGGLIENGIAWDAPEGMYNL